MPSPDPVRLSVPKAFVMLRGERSRRASSRWELFRFVRGRLPGYKRIRCIEFADLPKTISGKIRRVDLRVLEARRRADGVRGDMEFWEGDFPELRTKGKLGG